MHQSDEIDITHAGKPAKLSVIRNDGFCWGRIRFTDGRTPPLDVNTRRDQYNECDVDAREAFEAAARKPRNVSPAVGWLTD